MSNTLLTQAIKRSLLVMTVPAAFGMLMTFVFQLVDSYFVGQLGSDELAAMGFAFPVYFLIISSFMGVAAGVSSTVAKALGEGYTAKAAALSSQSQALFMLLALLLGLLGYVSIPTVFQLLGAPAQIRPLISDYMQPIYLGMFALVGTLIANATLMSKGKMLAGTAIMGLAGIINLVFDYLLIFGHGPFPALALRGAAYATVLSWSVSLLLMLFILHRQKLLALSALFKRQQWQTHMREVLRISAPAIAAQVLNPLAIAVITRLIAQFGNEAVAAFGIATRLQSLGLVAVLALSVIITPLAAQHYGAGLRARLAQIVTIARRVAAYWSLGFYLVLLCWSDSIVALFTDSTTIIAVSRQYFLLVGASLAGFALAMISSGFFNGVQQPGLSLRLTLCLYLLLTIPLALLGSQFGLNGIWLAIATSNLLGALYATRLLRRWQGQQETSSGDGRRSGV